MKHLSGGNIQKLILGREIAGEHALLVAAHPTYGLDVGATEYVRRLLLAAAREGQGGAAGVARTSRRSSSCPTGSR